MSEQEYHNRIARILEVDPSRMAIMGTAANMKCMAHRQLEVRDLRVDVFVTGGVEANAARSGDPATFYEQPRPTDPAPPYGTINTIVIVQPRLTAAAYAYAAVLDRLRYGTLPAEMAGQILRDQGATAAVASILDPAKWAEFRDRLPARSPDRLEPFVKGLVMGLADAVGGVILRRPPV